MRYILSAFLLMCLAAGAQAQTHQVALTWTASASTGLTGYNVYRLAGACPASVNMPSFTKLTPTPVTPGLTYTDNTVTSGTTYCYAITAVAPGGESGPGGTLQVTISTFTASAVPGPPGPLTSSQQ